jgi:hypothetical protein
MGELTTPGTYQVEIQDIKLQDSERSEAIMVGLEGKVVNAWQSGEWLSCSEWPDTFVRGTVVLFKGDGTVNESGVNQLKNAFGWDPAQGVLGLERDFIGVLINATCKVDSYVDRNNQTVSTVKITWIDSCDARPSGGLRGMDESRKKALAQSLDARLRGLGSPAVRKVKPADEIPF